MFIRGSASYSNSTVAILLIIGPECQFPDFFARAAVHSFDNSVRWALMQARRASESWRTAPQNLLASSLQAL